MLSRIQPRFFVGLILLTLVTGLSAQTVEFKSGNKRVHLLELFTSQGCSSCPAAESWLNQFTHDKRLWSEVIPLAFHVDYWDYLGWKDPYSDSAYSRRQQTYRQQGGIRSVYTPGFVLNGKEWRRWYRQQPEFANENAPELSVKITDGNISARLDSASATPLRLNLALVGFDIKTAIKAGENSGRHLSQEFVVLEFTTFVSANGHWQAPMPKADDKSVGRFALVAWVSESATLRPIQATGGWLPGQLDKTSSLN